MEFGIDHPIHVNRAKTSVNQLVIYQQAIDKKLKKEKKLREKEKPYFDLLDEANVLRAKDPPYQSPRNIKYWKSVDVFMWLEAKENVNQLGLFIKPFAIERVSGKDLLSLVEQDDAVFHDVVSVVSLDVCRAHGAMNDVVSNSKTRPHSGRH